MKFTEAQLEQAFIDLLGQVQIPYVPGEAILRTPQEVLIKSGLENFLSENYKSEKITKEGNQPISQCHSDRSGGISLQEAVH